MKKYFITGLILLLPITITWIVVKFVIDLLTTPFLGVTKAFLNYYHLDSGLLFLNAEQLQDFISKILILLALFFFTVLLGLVARLVLFHYLIRMWEYVIHRIPIIKSIYKSCQDVITTLFASQATAFKQVVMVRFPSRDNLMIGFVTRDPMTGLDQDLNEYISVFVPTTPNPTSGFLLVCKKQEVIPLEIAVEDALKMIVSCGVIIPQAKANSLET